MIARVCSGVDLLVHDAQFLERERAVADAYGHATVDDAVDLAPALPGARASRCSTTRPRASTTRWRRSGSARRDRCRSCGVEASGVRPPRLPVSCIVAREEAVLDLGTEAGATLFG